MYSLTLKEEHEPQEFENGVLMEIRTLDLRGMKICEEF